MPKFLVELKGSGNKRSLTLEFKDEKEGKAWGEKQVTVLGWANPKIVLTPIADDAAAVVAAEKAEKKVEKVVEKPKEKPKAKVNMMAKAAKAKVKMNNTMAKALKEAGAK